MADGEQIKKPRVRKAPTVREQLEAARQKDSQPKKAGRLTVVKNKLPKRRFGLFARLWSVVKFIFRPLRFMKRPLRWLMPTYFLNAWRELKLVTWPTRRETWRLTLAVFIFATVFGLLVAGVDKILDYLFKHVILK